MNENVNYDFSLSDDEMTKRFQTAVALEIKKKIAKQVPISKYDLEKKRAYLEYPDGRKVYA